jgi:hypothetical protein
MVRPAPSLRLVVLSACALSVVATASCNRRVFELVEPTCDATIASDVDIPTEKAADILIVVDNSGSMAEEQANLKENFINARVDGSGVPECPIDPQRLAEFATCDTDAPSDLCEFANPSAEDLSPGDPQAGVAPGRLSRCGFIQVLAAFENDFRVGVITTDVGICDNRSSGAQGGGFCENNGELDECSVVDDSGAPLGGGWGYRPQRGCLQPNGPPGTRLKVIARSDLTDDAADNDDIGDRFGATLDNIRTFGTAFERGLDAMQLFLDPATERDPSCDGDLQDFLRPEAKLVVIFLTDEEDCSRLPDDNDQFVDNEGDAISEFSGESCDEFVDHFNNKAAFCYANEERLTPVERYAEFLKTVKARSSDISIATIAGAVTDADGKTVADGCFTRGGEPDRACYQSGGKSNSIAAGQDCSDSPPQEKTCRKNQTVRCTDDSQCADGDVCVSVFDERGCVDDNGSVTCEKPCCVADAGDRYFALADQFPDNSVKDSICFGSFRQTMIKIAVEIGDVESVQLAEPPADPALVFVEKAPADSNEYAIVPRAEGTECAEQDGWILDVANPDDIRVRFCGRARPGPGERVRVRAKGQGADPDGGADACANRGG